MLNRPHLFSYMLATACLNGRLWNWLSLHPDNTKAHQEEEDGKSFVWDKHDMAVTYEHACFVMILSFSHCVQVFYRKTCLKGGNGLAETFFRHKHYCHACHTGFAVFFPMPSCDVSLFKQSKNPPLLVGSHLHLKQFPWKMIH